jgi:hypothetical protein
MTKQTLSTQTTSDGDTDNPGGQFAGQGDAENGKSKDWVQGAGMGGTKAQDHADRRGKAGAGMVDKGAPLPGGGTNSQ